MVLATLAVQLGSSLFQKGELEGDEALCRSLCLSGSARRKAIDRRWLPEATLLTLDLGLLWLGTGREREVDALIEEIATTFAEAPGLDLALGGLAHAAEDATAGRLNPEIWNGMASMLRLAFRLQGIPLRPVPFA